MERVWQRASWAALNGSKDSSASAELSALNPAPAMKLANGLAWRARFEGQNTQGLHAHWLWFVKEDKLYQAGIYHQGEALERAGKGSPSAMNLDEVLETYFESFR
jgi:hypothetical protein